MYIMLNSIYKTVAYATQLVPQLDIVNPSKIIFTMPSTLMNIIYVMPKSTRAAYRCDDLTW